jgi:hypothetical protein
MEFELARVEEKAFAGWANNKNERADDRERIEDDDMMFALMMQEIN